MFDTVANRRKALMLSGAAIFSALADAWRVSAAPFEVGVEPRTYSQAILAGAPVAYWQLNESRGPTARDVTGRGNDARGIGRPVFGRRGAIASDPGRAVSLQGQRTVSYLEVRDRDHFSVATSGKGLTVEVWMRPDVLDFTGEGSDHLVHWLGKGERGCYEWGFRFYGRRGKRPNRISAYIWNADGKLGAGAYVEEPMTAGEWVYLVASFDDPRKSNSQVRLYKNGQPSQHNKSPGTLYRNYQIVPRHGPAPLRLGTRDLRSFFTGGLDEVAIYPRVLGADEILNHWRASRGK